MTFLEKLYDEVERLPETWEAAVWWKKCLLAVPLLVLGGLMLVVYLARPARPDPDTRVVVHRSEEVAAEASSVIEATVATADSAAGALADTVAVDVVARQLEDDKKDLEVESRSDMEALEGADDFDELAREWSRLGEP